MLQSAHNFFCLFHKHVMLHGTKASFVLVIEPKKSAVLYEFATCTAVEGVRRAAADLHPPSNSMGASSGTIKLRAGDWVAAGHVV